MYVSLCLLKRMEIQWGDIEEIIENRDALEQILPKNALDFIARSFIYVRIITPRFN